MERKKQVKAEANFLKELLNGKYDDEYIHEIAEDIFNYTQFAAEDYNRVFGTDHSMDVFRKAGRLQCLKDFGVVKFG